MIKTCWVGGPPQVQTLKTRKPLKVIKDTLKQPMTVNAIASITGYDVSHVRRTLLQLQAAGKTRFFKGNTRGKLWELT